MVRKRGRWRKRGEMSRNRECLRTESTGVSRERTALFSLHSSKEMRNESHLAENIPFTYVFPFLFPDSLPRLISLSGLLIR